MKGFLSGIVNLLFPPRCIFCEKPLQKGKVGYCGDCSRTLPYTDGVLKPGENISVCVAPLKYVDTVRKSFHRFKFKGKISYATPYGEIIAEEIRRAVKDKYDLITWIPVSSERRESRGYDQAMLLAYAVALELDDVALETLSKVKDTQAQSELKGRSEREKNIFGAYKVISPELVAGKRILLIDDVYTTGATMQECAKTLLESGAGEVIGAVLCAAGGQQY